MYIKIIHTNLYPTVNGCKNYGMISDHNGGYTGGFPYNIPGTNSLSDINEIFDPDPHKCGRGLYFSDIKYTFKYLNFGNTLCIVCPLKKSKVVDMGEKLKTDILYIDKAMELWTPETFKFLISRGAKIHIYDDCALRWSAYHGFFDIIKILVENGANVRASHDDTLDHIIYNPTHSDLKKTEMVKYLCERGSRPNKITFISACSNGYCDIVKYFCEIDANILHDWGKRGLDIAKFKNNTDIIEYFKNKGIKS